MKHTRFLTTLVVLVGILLSGCGAISPSLLGLVPAVNTVTDQPSPDDSNPNQAVSAELGSAQAQS